MKRLSIVGISFLLLGLFIGWKVTSTYFEAEMNAMLLQIQEQEQKSHVEALEKTIKNTETLTVKLGELNNETSNINNKFMSLSKFNIEQLRTDTSSDTTLRTDTSSDTTLRTDTRITERNATEKKDRCVRQDHAKFQRLYEQQLEVARDCDITATYYNKLLELYENVR